MAKSVKVTSIVPQRRYRLRDGEYKADVEALSYKQLLRISSAVSATSDKEKAASKLFYTDWKGEHRQKCKRGFQTRREAQEWEHTFQMQTSSDMDMSFEAFAEIYTRDIKPRLKETTWLTKEHIIRTKLLPSFGKRKLSEISTKDVIAWQNELLAHRDEQKKPYSAVYLKTMNAVREQADEIVLREFVYA